MPFYTWKPSWHLESALLDKQNVETAVVGSNDSIS